VASKTKIRGNTVSHCEGLVVSVKSAQDLKQILRKTGYSGKAVEEILKWYLPSKQGKRA